MDNQDYRSILTMEDKVRQGLAVSLHDLPPLFREGDLYELINFIDHVVDLETGDEITRGTPLIRRTFGYMDEALYHMNRALYCADEIAVIPHNLGRVPLCRLFMTEYAAGTGGAGEGPAGGGRAIETPARFEALDSNTVKVYSTPAFAGSPEVRKLNDNEYTLVYPESDINLFLIMR